MSSIPPNSNIVGSIFQSQVSSAETSRSNDAQRNKRAQDARELARQADRKTSEVEDTDHTEDVIVRRQDERNRDGQDARDTWEKHQENQPDQLYQFEAESKADTKNNADQQQPDVDNPPSHIDLTA